MKKHSVNCNWLVAILSVTFILVACRQEAPADVKATQEVEDPTTVLPTVDQTESVFFPATVGNYDLGEATILQEHYPEDSHFRNMPVRLEGVIGAPEEDGSYPVVLIMHGLHPFCPQEDVWPCPEERANYAGFTYFVEALAEAGYVALSININAEHTFAHGEAPPTVRTAQLIDMHLQELMAANAGESDKFGIDLNGRVDISRMVWIGHSRGADYVNRLTREKNLNQTSLESGYGPVQGIILLAPPIFTLDMLPAADLSTALILPACDQDVPNLAGQTYYESARLDPDRSHLFTTVYLKHANHNNFNTMLEPDSVPKNRPDCTEGAILAASDQQAFLAQYTVDFLRTLYGSADDISQVEQRLGLDPTVAPPMALYDLPVQITTVQPAASRLTLMQPQSEAELNQNLLGGDAILTGLSALYCPEGYYTPDYNPEKSEPCRRVAFNQPGYPQQFLISWEGTGAEWRTAVPDIHADFTAYTTIQLRAALDPLSDLNAEGEPQSFTVELVDGNGNRAQKIIPQIAYPTGETHPHDFFEGDSFSGHVNMHPLQIPLAEFGDIDLENIIEIALIFDQTESGSLFIADLELISEYGT